MPNHHHLVLGNADGFFRAFEVLNELRTPRFTLPPGMPVGAGPVLIAAEVHQQLVRDLALLPTPSIVVLAFAVELLMKALLVKEGLLPDPTLPQTGRRPRGVHELDDLFALLPDVMKARIKATVADPDFDRKLAADADAFKEWRYMHEHQSLTCDDEFLAKVWRAARVEASDDWT